MHRTATLIALVGTVVAVPALGVAQAARVGVIPVPGNASCKVSPPHLLSPGRAPLRPLRLDLTGIGRRPHTVVEVETFATRAKALGGSWHTATEIRKIKGVTKGLGVSKGKIRLSSTLTVSFPGTKTVAPAKGGSFTVNGNSDALSGGLMGGSAGNDRFPVEPIGIGATWRVVDCDAVDEAPAKETRTYTLRAFTHDRAVMTYRDVVTMDPTRRDAGSQKVGGQVIKVTARRPPRHRNGHGAHPARQRHRHVRAAGDASPLHLPPRGCERPGDPRDDGSRRHADRHPRRLNQRVASRATTPVRSSVAAALAMSDSHGTPSTRTSRKCSSSVAKPIVAPVMLADTGTV